MNERQGHETSYNIEVSRVGSRGKEEQEARGRKEGHEARRNKESRKEEEASLSLDSRDYSLLSEEVERLQRQIEGMDQDRKVYQAATVKLVR